MTLGPKYGGGAPNRPLRKRKLKRSDAGRRERMSKPPTHRRRSGSRVRMHSIRMIEVVVGMHIGLDENRSGVAGDGSTADSDLGSNWPVDVRIHHRQRHQLRIRRRDGCRARQPRTSRDGTGCPTPLPVRRMPSPVRRTHRWTTCPPRARERRSGRSRPTPREVARPTGPSSSRCRVRRLDPVGSTASGGA